MFKNRLTFVYIILVLFTLDLPTFAEIQEEPNVTTGGSRDGKQQAYVIPWFVLDEGGKIEETTSESYRLKDAIGQSVIGKCESASYTALIGFWSAKALWVVGIEEESAKTDSHPEVYRLYQNYPNPMRNVTRIEYALPTAGSVILRIYNVSGQLVKTIVDELQESGQYSIRWNGIDEKGQRVGPGVYFYGFEAKNYKDTKKIILLR